MSPTPKLSGRGISVTVRCSVFHKTVFRKLFGGLLRD